MKYADHSIGKPTHAHF